MEKRLFLFIILTAFLLLTACNNDQENYMGQDPATPPEETEETEETEEMEEPAETEETDSEETDSEEGADSAEGDAGTEEPADTEESETEEGENAESDETEGSAITLTVMEDDSIGEYLADSEGMTLYYFADDEVETSTCRDACLFNWPALRASDVVVPEGYDESDFGTITREDDGEEHVTYKGYPLYYFRNDQAEGDVNGHGMNDAWFVVNDTTEFPD